MSWITDLLRTVDRWMRYLGLALIVLGAVAILAPLFAGVAVALVVGVVLLLAGVILALLGAQAREAGKGNSVLVLGGLAGVAGLVLLVQPTAGLAVVRWILIPYLLISGVSEAALAMEVRPEEGWTETLGGAVVSVAAGLVLWTNWPITGARAIGLMVGSKLIASGWAMIRLQRTLASAATRLASRRRG